MMREVVGKHFNDNWVVPLYMGRIVDLTVEWAPYRAAMDALHDETLTVRVGPCKHMAVALSRRLTHPTALVVAVATHRVSA